MTESFLYLQFIKEKKNASSVHGNKVSVHWYKPNKFKQQKTPFPSYGSNFIKYDADVTLYKFIIATTKLAKQPSLIFG